jgi:hypothetical protein
MQRMKKPASRGQKRLAGITRSKQGMSTLPQHEADRNLGLPVCVEDECGICRTATAKDDLARIVDQQVDFFRVWGDATGTMIADHLEALALRIRLVDAVTPAEYADRSEALDRDVRQQWQDVGFEEGRSAAAAELARKGRIDYADAHLG